jgi:hypothetical protein
VGLVEDHSLRALENFDPLMQLRVGDNCEVFPNIPRWLAECNERLAVGQELVYLPDPVCPQACRTNYDDWVSIGRFYSDEGLDRFAQAHLVSDDDSPLKKSGRDTACLVRP